MKKRGESEMKKGEEGNREDRVREGRPVTKLVEEIEGKEMQKETEVERLAGRSVEGRNNFGEEVEVGVFARALID